MTVNTLGMLQPLPNLPGAAGCPVPTACGSRPHGYPIEVRGDWGLVPRWNMSVTVSQ